MTARLYFDNNATTPLAPTVKPVLEQAFELKNPSSQHAEGRKAREALEKSLKSIGALLGCQSSEICITSGATESNHLVFQSVLQQLAFQPHRNQIITTSVEHDSVVNSLAALKNFEIMTIGVDAKGQLDEKAFDAALSDKTMLVTFMMANNETGMIFPLDWVKKAKAVGALTHTDAACGLGKISFNFLESGLDFVSASAHKFYGPRGIGFLLIRKGTAFYPSLLGGTQQKGLRAGTVDVASVLGLEAALGYALEGLPQEQQRLTHLRNKLVAGLTALQPNIQFHEGQFQLPGTVNVSFPGWKTQTLLARLDLEGVAASAGAACHSGAVEVSRVLVALGIEESLAASAIRLSFGKMTSEADVEELLRIFERILKN